MIRLNLSIWKKLLYAKKKKRQMEISFNITIKITRKTKSNKKQTKFKQKPES